MLIESQYLYFIMVIYLKVFDVDFVISTMIFERKPFKLPHF